jgi:lipoprotein-anchoring transpeptidase ErfK/SrfK
MSHRRRRLSRILLAVLGLTITVGLVSYAYRLKTHKAGSSNSTALASAATASAPATKPSEPPVTRAPEPTPATHPANPQAQPTAVAQAQPQPPATQAAGKPHVTEAPTANAVAESPAVALTAFAALPAKPVEKTAAAAPPGAPKVSVPASGAPASSVAEARELAHAGHMLEARDGANALLASGRLSGADAAAARQLLSEVNQTVVFSPRRFPDDKWGGTYAVQSGDRLDRIGAKFGVTPSLLMRLNGISDPRRLRSGATIKVLKGPFHAVVNKNAFRLDLYLGSPGGPDSVYVTSFPVGLGKDDSTPEGKWLVEPQKKIKNPVYYSPRGEGVIEADDPKNPLGEFWIGLSGTAGDAVGKQSYGIHGTIEPDSIGKQASMGCVRMRNEDVAVVFDALVEGKSTVLVTD